jgi:hypothetical protein
MKPPTGDERDSTPRVVRLESAPEVDGEELEDDEPRRE